MNFINTKMKKNKLKYGKTPGQTQSSATVLQYTHGSK